MRTLSFLTAVSVVALGIGGAAHAQQADLSECRTAQEEIATKMGEDPERRGAVSAMVARDLRQMRDTALRLDQYGKDDACQSLVTAMRDILENPEEYERQRGAAMAPGGRDAERSTEAARERPTGPDRWAEEREQSRQLSEMQHRLRAEELIGTDVRTADGESVGEVEDILFGGDRDGSYLIVSYGGFLGFGRDASPVPLENARVSEDGDTVFIDLTRDQLEDAPTFERGDWSWTEDEARREEIRTFYGRS